MPPLPPLTARPVRLDAPAGLACSWLAEPRNRPRWQSSLRDVDAVSPAGCTGPGTTWTDVTVVPAVRPRMSLTALDCPRSWTEEGTLGPFNAWLRLEFLTAAAGGCWVVPHVRVDGPAGLGRLLTHAALRAIDADLRRAAAVLTGAATVRP